MACPSGIDVPGFIALMAEGRDADAVELIRKDNPFPWVCGLVCTHPCEFICVRGNFDLPIAIKDLHGFAAERAMSRGEYRNPPKAPDNGRRVCVVGAGPAGLTGAYYLALRGYRVTVIEALPYAGGMMMVGIPRYRLPREVIDREVALIEELGVEFRYRTRLGKDVTIQDLRNEGYEAYLLAIGAHNSYKMGIKGEDGFPQVLDAIEFLRRVAMGDTHAPGRKVAVVGGGNVAIDAARNCLRLGCQEVTILYRRTRAEMPASIGEIRQAEEEGIRFSFLTVPIEVLGAEGHVAGLRCVRTELGPEDPSGRRRPIPVEGSEHVLELDTVVSAIGQAVDPAGLTDLADLEWSRRQTIVAHGPSLKTKAAAVFAAGDAVVGPATLVEAVGAGKRAAEGIDRHLQGIPQPQLPPVPVRRQRLACREIPASTKMVLKRPEMPLLTTERRRITFQQVELGYSETMARTETGRCLRCDICIRCGECVRICRDKMGIEALQLGYLEPAPHGPTDFRVTAERCILCGACATNCPTGAMRMEDREDERILTLCGTVLNRQRLEFCEACGAALGAARYHDFVSRRLKEFVPVVQGRTLCVNCARKLAAERQDIISPSRSRA